MKRLIVCVPLVAACVKTGMLSTSTSGASSDGNVTIPDVFKLKKADAIAALRKAGVEGSIDEDSNLCGSTVNGKIIELGEVCYQHPAPGQRQGARLVVSITVQTEDPRHGDIGRNTEWRLMPNLIGMTYDQAIAEMKRSGFTRTDLIQRTDSEDAACKPDVVCQENPDVLTRAGLDDGKLLYVGPRAAEPKRVATTDAAPAPTPAPGPASAPTSHPTSDASAAPGKPTADAPPAPLFGGPPAPQPPAPAPPAKHHGGNGAAPYRDGEGRVHGPGGPVYMGKGELCTAQIDHCMRPGVLFSADNYKPGAMYRGVPVFKFENKWWSFWGEPVEPKHLFRTATVDKPEQIEVGKPVVFFSEEGHDRFLDSEFEMLTSSRWEVGVVESVGTDKIKISGWGDVPLDTVRRIVEEVQP